MKMRAAVLASGGGSNLQALLDHQDALGDAGAVAVALVASDRPGAYALERAAARGIATRVMDRAERTDGLAALLRAQAIDLVVLAGYLRFVPEAVTRAWHGRVVNVHPALLPAFGGAGMYGHRVHEAVLAAGARWSGVTVHFVDEHYDRGPIIAQWPVRVAADDTPDSLAARVLRIEHRLYPRAVQAVADGRVALGDDGRVRGDVAAAGDALDLLLEQSLVSSTEPRLASTPGSP